jgi:hypothetical protein
MHIHGLMKNEKNILLLILFIIIFLKEKKKKEIDRLAQIKEEK